MEGGCWHQPQTSTCAHTTWACNTHVHGHTHTHTLVYLCAPQYTSNQTCTKGIHTCTPYVKMKIRLESTVSAIPQDTVHVTDLCVCRIAFSWFRECTSLIYERPFALSQTAVVPAAALGVLCLASLLIVLLSSAMDLIEGDFVHQVLSDGDFFLSLAHVYRQAGPHRIIKVQPMLPVGPNSAFFRRHHWRAGHSCMRPAPSNPTAIRRCLPQQCQWPCRNLDAQQTG